MSITEMTRWTRGIILLYLGLVYPARPTLAMIQAALRTDGIMLGIEYVKLHLSFLAARGYVQFRNHDSLPLATLTERGRQLTAACVADTEILWEEPCQGSSVTARAS